jgi:hypothetical protein
VQLLASTNKQNTSVHRTRRPALQLNCAAKETFRQKDEVKWCGSRMPMALELRCSRGRKISALGVRFGNPWSSNNSSTHFHASADGGRLAGSA